MKKTLLTISLLLAGFANANDKELTFYKDLTHYKENQQVNLDERVYITLTDTAVLDTFNVSLKQNKKLLTPKSVEIHPQSEENIFKLNKNETVFINGSKYTLIENGKGFIKVRNQEGLITYIPKSNIEIISFTNDVNATSHIAQVVPNEAHGIVDMAYSYALGEMSWKPKYDLYLKDKNKVQLDYNIEINNETLSSFEDVKVKFMLESIDRIYSDYISDNNGGIFDYEQYLVIRKVDGQLQRNYEKRQYDSEGYDQYGYDKVGFNKTGAVMANYNKVSSVLEHGKRAFEFSNLVNIPAKSKTSYPFKNALEMSYEKKNELYVNSRVKINDVLVPSSSLNVKNETGVTLSAGVLRVFGGDKGYESTVIKEQHLAGNKGDEDIKISIGENYGVKVKITESEKIMESKYVMSDSSKLYGKLMNEKPTLKSQEYRVYKISVDIDNVSDEKTLNLMNDNLISSSDIKSLKKLIKEGSNKGDVAELSDTELVNLDDKIEALISKEYKIDLTKETKNTFYLIEKQYSRR